MTAANKKVRCALLCLFYFVASLLFVAAVIGDAMREWYDNTFNVSFETLLYTAAVPLKGMDNNVFESAVPHLLTAAIACAFFLTCEILFDTKVMQKIAVTISVSVRGRKERQINFRAVYRWCAMLLSLAMAAQTLRGIDSSIHFVEYITKTRRQSNTDFYEHHYVFPDKANISVRTEGGRPKNILLIYVESMETTYASKDCGGAQEQNLIPQLTRLAKENVSFSSSAALGGLHNATGSGWTMGSIFSSSAGVPFAFPVEGNSMNLMSSFASGITAIGDILERQGYVQEFLCGSDGDFAGRKDFFIQHGNYDIFDYYTAIEKGYIDKDYRVWWGFEDAILYKIARDELLRLSKGEKPFNLTMLTVDMHHVGGYVCSLCENNFAEPLANVVYCADKQLGNFIDWCKEQDFFKDTVIVITGDHPRMDDILVKGTSYFDRTVYDCFINAQTASNANTTNRTATTMDLFPTILYAAGFSIEGERLGLGTNLFSGVPTLTEELCFGYVNRELSCRSKFYIDNFR